MFSALVILIAVVAAIGRSGKPPAASPPAEFRSAPNQQVIHLDDGGIVYVTDNKVTAVAGGSKENVKLVGALYTPGSLNDTDYNYQLWKYAEMSLRKPDGSVAKVWVSRPLWWFEVTHAKVGATVPLNIQEAGISGEATIHKIEPLSPSDPPKPGYSPVIGKIEHQNATVLELVFEGEKSPLGVTASHPLWSSDREDWIPAGNLRLGERVTTVNGVARLLSKSVNPDKHTVYNLEVHRSHSYHVGELGLLAHNTGLECERVMSVYEWLRTRNIPGDPVDAFARTLQRLSKMSESVKSGVVEGVVKNIDDLKKAGQLDQRLVNLGTEASGFNPREVFVARRFEMKLGEGKQLTRSNQGADFFDGIKHWDAKGPFPADFFDAQWGNIQKGIDDHYLFHWQAKNEHLLVDLAGLKEYQKNRLLNYLKTKDPQKLLYEVLE